GNVIIDNAGHVKLMDFGVARIADSGEATRAFGSMVGTLKYMAPEQIRGYTVDHRADLFAAGVVLYQLLTGRRPFDGPSEFDITNAIVNLDPTPPSAVNRSLPIALDTVMMRALAKNRDERFASARDFAAALRAVAQAAPGASVAAARGPAGQAGTATSYPPATATPSAAATTGAVPTKAEPTATASATAATAISQELELVYWKDVTDTDDPEDLVEFLKQFPSGVYANLARRRLRKLSTPTGVRDAEGSTVSRAATKDSTGGDPSTVAEQPIAPPTPSQSATPSPDSAEAPAAAAMASTAALNRAAEEAARKQVAAARLANERARRERELQVAIDRERQAEEERRVSEAKVRLEEEARLSAERKRKEEEERQRIAAEQARREEEARRAAEKEPAAPDARVPAAPAKLAEDQPAVAAELDATRVAPRARSK
ncbi:MAG: protein kinase domain-containing protein, partial [bacterium]